MRQCCRGNPINISISIPLLAFANRNVIIGPCLDPTVHLQALFPAPLPSPPSSVFKTRKRFDLFPSRALNLSSFLSPEKAVASGDSISRKQFFSCIAAVTSYNSNSDFPSFLSHRLLHFFVGVLRGLGHNVQGLHSVGIVLWKNGFHFLSKLRLGLFEQDLHNFAQKHGIRIFKRIFSFLPESGARFLR